MSIVSVAIVLSFHLKSEPSELELRMAKPLGVIFWCLAVSCLCLGIGNYISEFLSSFSLPISDTHPLSLCRFLFVFFPTTISRPK